MKKFYSCDELTNSQKIGQIKKLHVYNYQISENLEQLDECNLNYEFAKAQVYRFVEASASYYSKKDEKKEVIREAYFFLRNEYKKACEKIGKLDEYENNRKDLNSFYERSTYDFLYEDVDPFDRGYLL